MKIINHKTTTKNSLYLYAFNTYSIHKKENPKKYKKKEKRSISVSEKFINLLMISGKKSKASKILYNALTILRQKTRISTGITSSSVTPSFPLKKTKNKLIEKGGIKENQWNIESSLLHIILEAIENVKPSLEVRKVRIAGITYQVPSIIKRNRQENLAIRWLIESAKSKKIKSNNSFSESLAQEILDAFHKQGQARQKRDDLHKVAESNRAYVRYRWW